MPSPLPFQRLQQEFAAYVRDPEGASVPAGVEPRRMAVYARLVYNNMESILGNVFSGLRDTIGKTAWEALAHDFVRYHYVGSPYYSKLPDEFLAYLTERKDATSLPPFAAELCHYAWVKYALRLAPDMSADAFDDDPVEADEVVAVSSLAWPLEYAFPVRDLGPDCRPSSPPENPTYLIGYRNRHHVVRFMASNAATLRLLDLIGQGRQLGQCFAELAAELRTPLARVEGAGLAIVNRLHAHDVVVRAQTG